MIEILLYEKMYIIRKLRRILLNVLYYIFHFGGSISKCYCFYCKVFKLMTIDVHQSHIIMNTCSIHQTEEKLF